MISERHGSSSHLDALGENARTHDALRYSFYLT
jgi:hypothetical protein